MPLYIDLEGSARGTGRDQAQLMIYAVLYLNNK